MNGCSRLNQERLPKERTARGIEMMQAANRYLADQYRVGFKEEFAVPAAELGSAFLGRSLARD